VSASASRELAAAGEPEIDPTTAPEIYASVCVGTCLEPIYPDGSCLVFGRDERPHIGDYVGLWFKREHVPAGEYSRMVKRLVSAPPPADLFPIGRQSGDVVPILIVEQHNPKRRFKVPWSHLRAVHKVLGVAKSQGNGRATWKPPQPSPGPSV
jgi:hypothetical protein